MEYRYRFIASNSINTNPLDLENDDFSAIHESIECLTKITGRNLINNNGQLITSNQVESSGINQFTTTYAPLKPLRVVLMGLLNNVSLKSARKLTGLHFTKIVDAFSHYHNTKIEEHLNKILLLNPDLIIFTGGTDGGAHKPVLKSLETLKMVLSLFPEGKRPEVLYAGNEELADTAVEMIEPLAPIYVSQNIRPNLEDENLGPAENRLIEIINAQFLRIIKGNANLQEWSGGNVFPISYAIGRATKLFSKIISENNPRSVLCVHFGSHSTIVASSYDSLLDLQTLPEYGSRNGFNKLFTQENIKNIRNWVPYQIADDEVNDYLNNLVLHPTSIPKTNEESLLDNSINREVIRHAIKSVSRNFNSNIKKISPDFLPLFDLIIVGGESLSNIPDLPTSLLTILDAIQPTGLQQIILDKNNLMSLLGSAIRLNPDLVSQLILDPIAFTNLGFVISPVSHARSGKPVLRIRIAYESGHENTITFKKGNIYKIPLQIGQKAKILLEPLNRADLGCGPGKRLPSKMVTGGPFGIVIDARGRPLTLPEKEEVRFATLQGWNKNLI